MQRLLGLSRKTHANLLSPASLSMGQDTQEGKRGEVSDTLSPGLIASTVFCCYLSASSSISLPEEFL